MKDVTVCGTSSIGLVPYPGIFSSVACSNLERAWLLAGPGVSSESQTKHPALMTLVILLGLP